MDTSNMYIAFYDKVDEVTEVVRFGLAYVKGVKVDIENEPNWQPRKAGHGKTEEIVHTKKYIFHSTKKEAEGWYQQPGHRDYLPKNYLPSSSWLGVPMILGNQVLGVIATYQDRENVYSVDDLSTLQNIANQAAIALDNARSYVKIDNNLRAMRKFGETIIKFGHPSEPQIIDLIYTQVSDLMNADSMYVALYDSSTQWVRFGIVYENGVRKDLVSRKVDLKRRGEDGGDHSYQGPYS